jgi:hypothetical protein
MQGPKTGTTVADLQRKGAVPLNDAQLNELLVGKSVWMRNSITGGRYESLYEKNGHVLINHVGRNAIPATEAGKLDAAYSIQNDRVVTSVENTRFNLTFYKLGDTYYAARSDEFGYANYQITPRAPDKLVDLRKVEARSEARNGPPAGTTDCRHHGPGSRCG